MQLVFAVYFRFIKDSVPAILIGSLLFVFPSKLPCKHIAGT